MKKLFVTFAAAVSFLSLNAEILWQADLSKESGGFNIVQARAGDSVKIENGELVLNFTNGVDKGINLAQRIPFPETCDLVFDAVNNVGNKPGYNAWSLKMSCFGKLIAWFGTVSNGNISVYDPKDNPSMWTKVAVIPSNKKVNYRFRINRTKGTLDVFVDDSFLPVKSFKNIKFPEPKDGTGVIQFGNYGYATGAVTHKISNLRLESVSETSAEIEQGVVWAESFKKNGSLADNGYTQAVDNQKDQFTVQDGVMTMSIHNTPYKGSKFEKKIPGLISGELTFEAWNGAGADSFSYSISMGDIVMSWYQNNSWQIYHVRKNKWYSLTKQIKPGVWNKYRVVFDAVKRTAEYYVNDMENPVYIDEDSQYIAKRKVLFRFGNWGLCTSVITNKIRNIELKTIDPKKKTEQKPPRGTMIFRGVSDDYWPLKLLAGKLGEKEIMEFFVHLPDWHTTNDNVRFDLQPKPKPSLGPAKYIILADIPATPIPDYTLKMIRQSVEAGGKLIILDGLFTLQKGEYAGTVLEEIIPVSLKNKWGKTDPLPDADIYQFNEKNAVISKSFGKGKVYIVCGNAVRDPSVTEVLNHYTF